MSLPPPYVAPIETCPECDGDGCDVCHNQGLVTCYEIVPGTVVTIPVKRGSSIRPNTSG